VARVVVNATGTHPVGSPSEQIAYGLLLPAAAAEPLVPADTALIMDWSRPAREPSFLYAVPVGDRILVEETSLARKPGLPREILVTRLRHRLAAAGIPPVGREEIVAIPLDLPPVPGLAFGAAAGLVHPATGYSVATSLQLAPRVAEALLDGLRRGPAEAVRAARHVIWPRRARVVHALRSHGLHALRGMPSHQIADFFDIFFQLPVELQSAFTSGRTDIAGTTAAMREIFRAAPWRLRSRLIW